MTCFNEMHTLVNVRDTCANPEENGSVKTEYTSTYYLKKINMKVYISKVYFYSVHQWKIITE